MLVLLGFMGAGKSTVGKVFARELGCPFIDLDVEISKTHGAIPELFSARGESGFRAIEHYHLDRILPTLPRPAVLALGGGAFLQPANRELLSQAGATTIFLDAPFEVIRARISHTGAERPLARDMDRLLDLFYERRPAYRQAQYTFDASHSDPAALLASLVRLARRLGAVPQIAVHSRQGTPQMICRKCTLVALLLFPVMALATSKPAPKGGTVIDQGTFGIFQGGNRLGTETFVIRQYADTSVTTAQLRSEGAAAADQQSVELALHADGTLDHYQWDQLSPVKSSATVDVSDSFLTMHINAEGKLSDVPFFLTSDVFVLDDYFFAAREVLIWRYLAIACKPRPTGGCDLARTRIPILIRAAAPPTRSSSS